MVNIMFDMLVDLLHKRSVTAQYFATKHEISIRTVYRYCEYMQNSGVPIVTRRGKNGGISVAENMQLKNTYFTAEEYARIVNALKSFEAPDDLCDKVTAKLLTLSNSIEPMPALLKNDTIIVENSSWGETEKYREKAETIASAINKSVLVKITYRSRDGEETDREVEPHAFVLKDNVWYVFCYCLKRGDFRLFKLSRIARIDRLPVKFTKRDTSEYKGWELNYAEKKGSSIDITLRVHEKVRYDVEEWLGVEAVQPSKTHPNHYIASATVYENESLLPKLLSFSPHITVLSPDDIREKLKNTVGELVKTLG
jgi:predicted DNA-binding transcriptional regulator YafY